MYIVFSCETLSEKIRNKAGKNALKSVKLPSLKIICWKLTQIYGSLANSGNVSNVSILGGSKLDPPPPAPSGLPTTQTSVHFRDFVILWYARFGRLTFKLGKFTDFKAFSLAVSVNIRVMVFIKTWKKTAGWSHLWPFYILYWNRLVVSIILIAGKKKHATKAKLADFIRIL